MSKNNKNNTRWRHILVALSSLILILFCLASFFMSPADLETGKIKTIKYSDFQKQVEKMDIQKSEMSLSSTLISINGTYKNKDKKERKFTATLPKTDKNINKAEKLLSKDGGKVEIKTPSMMVDLIYSLVSYLPMIIFIVFLIRIVNAQRGNIVNNKATTEVKKTVKFSAVAGCEEEKREVQEIVEYLKQPEKFTKMGARIPSGILMSGSPGTGKTLLAKAVAGEADVPFYYISGSDFVELYVGVGASRVRNLFKEAAKNAPCIIFIDEIDAIGKRRTSTGKNTEQDQALNQILVEMDGMDDNSGVIVIAATNRPDVLDPALLRSGRFDRQIRVQLPDVKGREEILKVHAKNKKFSENVNFKEIAKRTPGFSGADLENLINESAILAVRNNEETISTQDLDEAIDRVMMGPAKKSKKYTEKDKWLVSIHEAGHAVIGICLEDADEVQKVTIIPRGDAGGYNLMMPKEEKMFPSKNALLAQITGLLGGRCAEEMVFGDECITAGASNDIEKLSNIARKMVKVYGMSNLGPVSFVDDEGNDYLGNGPTSGEYSEDIARTIDKEVNSIILKCKKDCRDILEKNRPLLDKLAKELYEKETLTNEEIQTICKEF